jgi:hypothetical protein
VKAPPRPGGDLLRGHVLKAKLPLKTKGARFDTFVARHYFSAYSFASRLTDDPREAVLLTHDAFNKMKRERGRRRSKAALFKILLARCNPNGPDDRLSQSRQLRGVV